MLNSLIIAFFDQQIVILNQAMPAAGYAYAKVDEQIKKLEEYRTALISEYPSSLQHKEYVIFIQICRSRNLWCLLA
ncbi:MAG: hypothetical protein V7K27_06220 [Nostoc sp.]|uniref:hypothetical protein n=1 Tax=Nostoc sp. TaxID=1180 RepID=UPI002FF777A2